MRGKGLAKTALVIAPLAMSAPVMADTMFLAGTKNISSTSGGGLHGKICQAFPTAGGVSLSGNTDISGLNVDPKNYQDVHNPTGYLSAQHVAGNGGAVNFTWKGEVGGEIGENDFLNISHDFSVHVFRGDCSDGTDVPLSWTLSAKVTYFRYDTDDLDYVTYALSSAGDGQGAFTGLANKPFHAGQAEWWEVHLDFNWAVNAGKSVINPNDRLAIDIPTGTSIDLTIGPSPAVGAVAAPLPATAWMGSALLGWVGIGRLRRRVATSALPSQ